LVASCATATKNAAKVLPYAVTQDQSHQLFQTGLRLHDGHPAARTTDSTNYYCL
jgi:hypothetical protein